MEIRFANLDDLNVILSLEKEWFEEGISPGMELVEKEDLIEAIKENRVLVAVFNSKIVGYLI